MDFTYDDDLTWDNEGTEPSDELRSGGFTAGYKPAASVFNWFWCRVGKCLEEIKALLERVTADDDGWSVDDYTLMDTDGKIPAARIVGLTYGECATVQATTAKTVEADGFTLTGGAMITVKFTNGIPAKTNITLDVNGTGAKTVTPNNIDGWDSVDFGVEQGSMLTFVYDAKTDCYVLVNEYAPFCYYAAYANHADALTAQAVSYDADEEELTIVTG